MKPIIIPKGRLPRTVELAQIAIANLDPSEAWKITAEPVKATRSNSFNAYLWAVPYKLISEATGYEIEEVHEYFLGRHFGWVDKKVPKTPRNPQGVESVPVRTSTTDANGKRNVLSTEEFSAYVAFIQRFAATKLGLVIPDPDQMHHEKERAA
jgi:hypothetical protein